MRLRKNACEAEGLEWRCVHPGIVKGRRKLDANSSWRRPTAAQTAAKIRVLFHVIHLTKTLSDSSLSGTFEPNTMEENEYSVRHCVACEKVEGCDPKTEESVQKFAEGKVKRTSMDMTGEPSKEATMLHPDMMPEIQSPTDMEIVTESENDEESVPNVTEKAKKTLEHWTSWFRIARFGTETLDITFLEDGSLAQSHGNCNLVSAGGMVAFRYVRGSVLHTEKGPLPQRLFHPELFDVLAECFERHGSRIT